MITHHLTHYRRSLSILLHALIAALPATAGEPRFVFSHETSITPVGNVEFEQWITSKASKASNPDFSRFEFRHEVEIGLTEQMQIGLYLADWRLTEGTSADGAEYRTSGLDVRYQLSDPNTSAFGSALYGEVLLGPEKFVLEGKLLLQKNLGNVSMVYNGVVEAEWEGDQYQTTTGVWKNTLGMSYQINPHLFLGLEAVHEVEFADWASAGDHRFYLGPNFSYRQGPLFVTVAPLFQLSEVSDEVDFMTRLLIGFDF
jgi:hypothetical protein